MATDRPVMQFDDWLAEKYSPREMGLDWDHDEGRWDPEVRDTYAEYIVRTWEEPVNLLVSRFSLDLIGWTLFEEVHVYARRDVSRELRDQAWDAVANLCSQLFEPFVSNSLSHLGETDAVAGMLDGTCYMWWGEHSPFTPYAQSTEPRDTEKFYEICVRGLESRRPPVQESILHGLAHILNGDMLLTRPQELIEWFLEKDLAARPELVRYAELAHRGEVQ